MSVETNKRKKMFDYEWSYNYSILLPIILVIVCGVTLFFASIVIMMYLQQSSGMAEVIDGMAEVNYGMAEVNYGMAEVEVIDGMADVINGMRMMYFVELLVVTIIGAYFFLNAPKLRVRAFDSYLEISLARFSKRVKRLDSPSILEIGIMRKTPRSSNYTKTTSGFMNWFLIQIFGFLFSISNGMLTNTLEFYGWSDDVLVVKTQQRNYILDCENPLEAKRFLDEFYNLPKSGRPISI